MPCDPRQSLGKLGEDLACAELRRRGYEIVARRYRTRYGEIDIVARHRGAVVFVEVKARATGEFGGAAAAVTGWKQRRIGRMALDFMMRHRLDGHPCRFDVVTIDWSSGEAQLEIIPDAFEAAS